CRGPEQRKQRVTDKLVNIAAISLHGPRQLLEQFVLQRAHQFRVSSLAERSKAAEIGKQNGQRTPVGGIVRHRCRRDCSRRRFGRNCTTFGRAKRCSTFWAKRKIGLACLATGGADDRLSCAALRAERKTTFDRKTTGGTIHRPASLSAPASPREPTLAT